MLIRKLRRICSRCPRKFVPSTKFSRLCPVCREKVKQGVLRKFKIYTDSIKGKKVGE